MELSSTAEIQNVILYFDAEINPPSFCTSVHVAPFLGGNGLYSNVTTAGNIHIVDANNNITLVASKMFGYRDNNTNTTNMKSSLSYTKGTGS